MLVGTLHHSGHIGSSLSNNVSPTDTRYDLKHIPEHSMQYQQDWEIGLQQTAQECDAVEDSEAVKDPLRVRESSEERVIVDLAWLAVL